MIVHGMNKELTVKDVKVFETLTMLVTFSTNEVRIFDVMEIVDKPAFKPLEAIDNFKTARVVDGVVTWLDGKIDLAPGTMYNLSYDYDTENVISV